MAENATQTLVEQVNTEWGGHRSPFKVSYGKIMMWFFLFSDALTFGSFLVSLGFARFQAQELWPIGEQTFTAIPFFGTGYPLMYVAFMTFLLILSSVTMVLAVEAGHRMNRRDVIKWLGLTIIGGLMFLGSQAWEWTHFIHGSHFGRVELADGSLANVVTGPNGSDAVFGEINSFKVTSAGHEYKAGQVITTANMDLEHEWKHAAEAGRITDNGKTIKLEDGSIATVNKAKDQNIRLVVKKNGGKYKMRDVIDGADAEKLYYSAFDGTRGKVIYGANIKTENEYGPNMYANYFFFITGFHGFHVTIGVIINIIIFINVLAKTYERRGHYEMVEKSGLYWHFVDLVWVFVFTFFYLI